MPTWRIVVALVALVLLGGIWIYNRLVKLRTCVNNGWSQIDVQLRRRYDLIPNLVTTVQGYATHEREVFEHVTEAWSWRSWTRTLSRIRAQAENQITRGSASFAVAENYPDLKATRTSWPCRRNSPGPNRRSPSRGSSTTRSCC